MSGPTFALARVPLDTAEPQRSTRDPAAGGYVAFEGWVRNHHDGRSVASLTYEAYDDLAVKEGTRVLGESMTRFSAVRAHCFHRIGSLQIGDVAVWVGVSAHHRDAAFLACRYIIDQLKVRVPIWKREHFSDGTTDWVNCHGCSAHRATHEQHIGDPRAHVQASQLQATQQPSALKPIIHGLFSDPILRG